ncbi:MAG: sigma-70 family RNA polymerase sigma factor [Acidobacteriaceae bacterium]|nr:sigma-70 family RNA polymerase sigma factor [Acidobacteriaceae bacterium]
MTDDSDPTFEALFSSHYGRVLGILTRLVGGHAQAEELTSEVFWKLYNQAPAARLWSNINAWLYRTAIHTGIDALRASARRKQYEGAASEAQNQQHSAIGPLDELLRAEERALVREVLSGMKTAQAQILLMRASGLSYKEIAEAAEVSVKGVGTLLNRAEAEFKKRYLKISKRRPRI